MSKVKTKKVEVALKKNWGTHKAKEKVSVTEKTQAKLKAKDLI